MMKSILSLCVVLALAVLADSALVQPLNTRGNLTLGYIAPGDTLLMRQYANQPARPNAIQSQDVSYVGNRNTRVTAVRATEVGRTQYAYVWVIRGGIGYNNVTLRIQSSRGYGYNYRVEVWGR